MILLALFFIGSLFFLCVDKVDLIRHRIILLLTLLVMSVSRGLPKCG